MLIFVTLTDTDALKAFRFKLNHAQPETKNIGPFVEHTDKPDVRGFYLHADASFPAVKDTATTILSPMVKLQRKNCLEFWLYLQPEAWNQLSNSVKVRNNINQEEFDIAASINAHPEKDWNGWKLVTINLDETTTDLQLNITAIQIGNSKYDIGIDDVILYRGQCKYFDYTCRPHYSKGQYIYSTVGNVKCTDEDNYRSKCDVNCKIGYHNAGGSPITCERFGWSDINNLELIWPPPYCDFLECSKFEWDKKIFEVECSRDFTYRSECAFECKNNFKLKGSSLATCHYNYTWSPELPSCIDESQDIEHKLTFTNTTDHSTWFMNNNKDSAREKKLSLAMNPNFDPAEADKKAASMAGASSNHHAAPAQKSSNKPVVTPLTTLNGGKSTDLPEKIDNSVVQDLVNSGETPSWNQPKTVYTSTDQIFTTTRRPSENDMSLNMFTTVSNSGGQTSSLRPVDLEARKGTTEGQLTTLRNSDETLDMEDFFGVEPDSETEIVPENKNDFVSAEETTTRQTDSNSSATNLQFAFILLCVVYVF